MYFVITVGVESSLNVAKEKKLWKLELEDSWRKDILSFWVSIGLSIGDRGGDKEKGCVKISLLVGGIGVMNIMLVSITERTREIGTRKALGATNGCIRIQFIVESIVICVIGGIIGILLGNTLGMIAANVMGYEASASIGGIIFAVTFSILIGVFFGYYPANKAAKLNFKIKWKKK